MKEKTYQFNGISSGDHESFCFDVTKEDFKNITGRVPSKFEKSVFNKGLYQIYPNDLLDGLVEPNEKHHFEITIKVN